MTWWNGMEWLNPPPAWTGTPESMTLTTGQETDFWQTTHYGFRRDDGHFLYRAAAGGFDAEAALALSPTSKYDQAGLMVRIGPGAWLKTSLEFEPEGPANLGAVVTNGGFSDWSMQPVTGFQGRLGFRVQRRGADYMVFARVDDGAWMRIRLARLHDDDGQQAVLVGPYACSPTGPGCKVVIDSFELRAR